MKVAQILRGRRESELLAFPSVSHMAELLALRCRESSWVRTSVASLERFRVMTGQQDLEALLKRARADPGVAEQSLLAFAAALDGYTDIQVSGLAMGAKLWYRFNGVSVSWRPLPGTRTAPILALPDQKGIERVILLSLIGSGLRTAELLRINYGDAGSLNHEGRLIPDPEADPLALRFTPRRGKPVERITFLTYQARQALLASFDKRRAAGEILTPESPLVIQPGRGSAESARQRSRALIRAGSDVNVALCRATGDFFREWGLPGSHFVGQDDLNLEDFI